MPTDSEPFILSQSGPLDWVEAALDHPHGRIGVVMFGDKPYGSLRSDAGRQRWLLGHLRGSEQPFIFPLLQRDLDVQWELTQDHPQRHTTIGTLSLPRLLGLPGDDPHRELCQYREFLDYIQDKRAHASYFEGGPSVQWFRGGHGNRGLEWSGLGRGGANLTEEEREEWIQELAGWDRHAWFAQWKKKNLEGLARVKLGPHCWFRLGHLRDRHEEMRQVHATKKAQEARSVPRRSP